MAVYCDVLRSILSRLERLGNDLVVLQRRELRRSSFEDICSRYTVLAHEAGEALGRVIPERIVRREDFGYSVGIVLPSAVQDLMGLIKDLSEEVKGALLVFSNTSNALPCPKAARRPCQMFGEINPNRFKVFFAIPFRNPPTCKNACNALIEWLISERGVEKNSIFRADQWTYSGDFVCKICKAMQESQVVVADITGGNPNVFFELGMAVGMGKPVILIHDEKVSQGMVPSDLLAWEYIPYDGQSPNAKEWIEHFGVIFDGIR